MDNSDDEDDLKLVKASVGLLSDLEANLPKVLWKKADTPQGSRRVHTQFRRRDLDYVVHLIEPFQGDPQLLDAKLKHILPPIVEAYLQYLLLPEKRRPKEHLDTQSSICVLLYTLCKVRGQKVIVGFFNNEPRYLEPILTALEAATFDSADKAPEWQVPFVLLLWLSHLLLTPFDLSSISNKSPGDYDHSGLDLPTSLPPLAVRLLRIALNYLPSPTKAQDAAASMLVRLATRPDMQRLRLADALVAHFLHSLNKSDSSGSTTVYERLGPLRFLSGVSASADLAHLIPGIYRTSEALSNDETTWVASNAVAKKVTVKISRNIAVLCLHAVSTEGPLLRFLETTSVLEDVIDYLLRSLGDRDTPVRYAAAKAISLIILELDSEMGHEVIQAVLDTFKEDMPRHGHALDFRTVNALKWHGLTLALAHILFKRSASPSQLPDIVVALISALQFQQRSATGSTIGTNVRDAANFGIWSLSRRYTTKELLAVDTASLNSGVIDGKNQTVIHTVAVQLILSACFDPAGNIRRGSSAALQELIGRHPNQVYEGIALVQIVDYQAVSLRRRAMVAVAKRASVLHESYWKALVDGLLGWRGLGSSDVASRDATAAGLAALSTLTDDKQAFIVQGVLRMLAATLPSDIEDVQGLVSSLASLLEADESHEISAEHLTESWKTLSLLVKATQQISPRVLQAELLPTTARLLAALCMAERQSHQSSSNHVLNPDVEMLVDKILQRHEDSILQTVPRMVLGLFELRRNLSMPLGCIDQVVLTERVAASGMRNNLQDAGKAIALGTLVFRYASMSSGSDISSSISTIGGLTSAPSVDWRIIGVKALQLAVETIIKTGEIDSSSLATIVEAVHHALNDYTIDERGDIGSLVRLQGISCTTQILSCTAFSNDLSLLQPLHGDIYRLSLEKLDRVRLAAAQCCQQFLGENRPIRDIAQVSSVAYFLQAIKPLVQPSTAEWKHLALLEGLVACAGLSAETLLIASRAALIQLLSSASPAQRALLLNTLTSVLKTAVTDKPGIIHATLAVLSFLLDMGVPHSLLPSSSESAPVVKWLPLLSTVQKSHHKSSDVSRLLAAVHVYQGLAEIPALRHEVLKKLVSMLKTNPYPRVRVAVAETLFVVTEEQAFLGRDWADSVAGNREVVEEVRKSIGVV